MNDEEWQNNENIPNNDNTLQNTISCKESNNDKIMQTKR